VASHGPVGSALSLRRSSGPLERGPGYLKGAGLAEWRLWVPGLASLRGVGLEERISCRPVQALGVWAPRRDRKCLEIMNACVSSAWQALGVQPGGAEIICAYAGLRSAAQQRSCVPVDRRLGRRRGAV
jgi:hypothetical protein